MCDDKQWEIMSNDKQREVTNHWEITNNLGMTNNGKLQTLLERLW